MDKKDGQNIAVEHNRPMNIARERSYTGTTLASLCAMVFILAPLSASAAESSLVWAGAPGGPEQITIQDEGT